MYFDVLLTNLYLDEYPNREKNKILFAHKT